MFFLAHCGSISEQVKNPCWDSIKISSWIIEQCKGSKHRFKFSANNNDTHLNNIPRDISPKCVDQVIQYHPTMLGVMRETQFVFVVHSFHPELLQVLKNNYATGHLPKDIGYFFGRFDNNQRNHMWNKYRNSTQMGKVKFIVTNNNRKIKNIMSHNILYLPAAHKNLLWTVAWKESYKKNTMVTSTATYSIFQWENGTLIFFTSTNLSTQ